MFRSQVWILLISMLLAADASSQQRAFASTSARLDSRTLTDSQLVELRVRPIQADEQRLIFQVQGDGSGLLSKLLMRDIWIQRPVFMSAPSIKVLAVNSSAPTFEQDYRACKDAAAGFNLYAEHSIPGTDQLFSERAQKYREGCLRPFLAPVGGAFPINHSGSRLAHYDVVTRVLGVILVGASPHCTATLVDADTVLTADHCLRNEDGSPSALSQALSKCADASIECAAYFARTAESDMLLKLRGRPTQSSARSRQSDRVYLKLAAEIVGAPRVRVVPATAQSELLIVGWSGLLGHASEKWSALMMYTSPDWPCAMGPVWQQTALHSCQTLRGFSGAPLIHRSLPASDEFPTGLVEIVGIHVASSELEDWAAAGMPSPALGEPNRWNLAVVDLDPLW